jgi:hypothetical protein
MLTHELKREPVERSINGVKKKFQNKARSYHFKYNSITKSIKYFLEMKNGQDPIQGVLDRGSYIVTNLEFVNPTFLVGTEEHAAEVDRQSQSINDQIMNNFREYASQEELDELEAIQNMEGVTDEERAKAVKNFIAYELVTSYKSTELQGLDREGKAEIITEIFYEFMKDFTGTDPDKWQYFSAIQFDTEHPHNHFLIGKYSNDGRKLNLHENYDRMLKFTAKMERHPKYGPLLEKFISRQQTDKNLPESMEDKYELQKEIQKCFSKDPFAFGETHQNLIKNKIILDPVYVGNKLKEVKIKRKGSKTISSLGLDKSYHIAMSRYFELKKISEKHDKYPLAEKILKAKEVISQNPTLDIEQLDLLLNEQGFGITANQQKDGKVNGYSLVLLDIQEILKLTTLAITTKQITSTAESASIVREKYKDFFKEFKPTKKQRIEYVGGVAMRLDALGYPQPLFRKRKKISDYSSLFEYMADSGGMYEIALKTKFSLRGDTFYHTASKVEKIRIVEQSADNLKTTVLASDRATAKAVAQLYLESGYKGFKITDGGNDQTSRNLWREGTLLGLRVEGYSPTDEDRQWFIDQLRPKVDQVRAKNLEAILAYKAEGKSFEVKVVSNQWTSVHRSPVAYAFVDMMKNGLDPMLVLNPPRKNGSKATEDDLRDYHSLILEVVRKECPEHLESAKRHLAPYDTAHNHYDEKNKIRPKA